MVSEANAGTVRLCSIIPQSHRLTKVVLRSSGLRSFLAGEPQGIIEEDPRTEDVPSQIVSSIAELKELSAVNGEHKPETTTTSTETKEANQKSPASDSSADEIDISKLDIRVGEIKKAWLHPEADKLYCEEIDIGEAEPRQIASGLRAHYDLEALEGQRVLVLANLKARKLVGFPSHGMVLCASSADGAVKFVEPPADANIGERVFVQGYEGEPATENQLLKKKMLEAIFPDLQTDSAGVATYKGQPLSTSAGVCKAPLPNSPIA